MRLVIFIFFIVLVACRHDSSSVGRIKMTNGIVVSKSDFPAVTQVHSSEPSSKPGVAVVATCTATWVHSAVLLTAAHCLIDSTKRQSSKVWVTDPKTGAEVVANPKNIKIHPRYRPTSGIEGVFDIAVIQFDRPVSEHVLSVVIAQANIGDPVQLVGFGESRVYGSDGGAKRFGGNTIVAIDGRRDYKNIGHPKDLIILEGARYRNESAQQSAASNAGAVNLRGDSGGPLLFKGQVLGVASTGAGWEKSPLITGSYISTFVHRDWLRQLGFSICGVSVDCPNTPKSDMEARRPGRFDGGSQQSQDTVVDEPDLLQEPGDNITLPIPAPSPKPSPTPSPNPAPAPSPTPSSTANALKDCNADYRMIRQGGQGVCINRSSGRCYQYGNSDVQYDRGPVPCSGGSGTQPPSVGTPGGNILDCNTDFAVIRRGGRGICLNRSSGLCYSYENQNVQYGRGRVACPR
jgi:hypothetical protein